MSYAVPITDDRPDAGPSPSPQSAAAYPDKPERLHDSDVVVLVGNHVVISNLDSPTPQVIVEEPAV
jgi:hypothetical protein